MFLEALKGERHNTKEGGQKTLTTFGHCEKAVLGCGKKSHVSLYLTTDTFDRALNTKL